MKTMEKRIEQLEAAAQPTRKRIETWQDLMEHGDDPDAELSPEFARLAREVAAERGNGSAARETP